MHQQSEDETLADLLAHLALEPRSSSRFAGDDFFLGHAQDARNGRIFGGLVFAQAMRAGQATVDQRAVHSAHGYFLRPGDPKQPIEYAVDRIRDGGSFSTRRIVAHQGEQAIFNLSMSFQVPEEAPGRQVDHEIPAEVAGETFEDGIVRAATRGGMPFSVEQLGYTPIEVRAVGGLSMNDAEGDRPPELSTWLRARGPVPDEPGLHEALLAYASDYTVVVAAQHPMPWGLMDGRTQSASLDHAIWFHDTVRIDDWIYAVHDSPVLKRSRALGRVLYYARDGRLVASAVQEGLMRRRD